jgi:hypothetical protein
VVVGATTSNIVIMTKCEKIMLLHVAYNTSMIRALNNVIYGKLRLFDLWKLHNLHQKTKSIRNLKHPKKQ